MLLALAVLNQESIHSKVREVGNIIGNSPINFFDRKCEQPCFAKAGDKVQFVAISLEEHKEIVNLVAYKRYKIESEVLDA